MRWSLLVLLGCGSPEPGELEVARALPSPAELDDHCRDAIGEPRVEEPAPGVFVAIGYDLANTTVIQTDDGRIVVDPGMSPTRSAVSREALDAVTEGPVRAVIYTHSHIDHVGGASVWVEDGTEVWATDTLLEHLYKQYAEFLAAENARGGRQFGRDVPREALACSALGRQVDIDAAMEMGFAVPTHTFSGVTALTVGSQTVELVEAHGETHDQLYVWLESERVLLPGDNYYRAFPNLYTIRGTSPRPVDAWIESLDAMRRRAPAVLVPSHTVPVVGEAQVEEELRNYRDGIQWVRDSVVRGANAGVDVDTLASTTGLPAHLAETPALSELYGQIDWSVRAIYGAELGWFDGQGRDLYRLAPDDRARRMIDLAGGPDAVLAAVADAEPGWRLELLGLLQDDGRLDVSSEWAPAYRAAAAEVSNTNGRAYLLQAAIEWEQAATRPPLPTPSDDFIANIPLDQLFGVMATRLMPDRAMETHESVVFRFPDEERSFVVTVRRGVAEIVEGEPLPGTPDPVAVVEADSLAWRRVALSQQTPAAAILGGGIRVESVLAFRTFMDRFDRRMLGEPTPP